MQTSSTSSQISQLGGIFVRSLLPIALIAVGWIAFLLLAEKPAGEKKEVAEEQLLRTNVTELRIVDYPINITTNGVVQAHNEVTLSAQVSGQVTSISSRFEVGAYFEKGDTLVELDDRDYVTALAIVQARKQSAEAALKLAAEDYRRLQRLHVTRNVAEAEVTQADAANKQAAAALDAANADVEQAQRDLDRTKIVAPFAGRVRTKAVGLGQSVGPGTALGTTFSIDFAEVRLPIGSSELQFLDLPELETDQPVAVELRNAIDNASRTVWKADIVRTEGALNPDSLELFAIARIYDPFGRKTNSPPLRIGQPVEATIAGKVLKNVVALPRMAVRQLDQIYMINKRELTLSSKTISAVWADEDYVVIRDPTISNGDLLSTTQLVYAPEGAKVEIIPDIELTASTANPADTENSATN